VDDMPPTGTLTINSGAMATTVNTVNLALAATDTQGQVAQMRLSGDGSTWAAWQPYTRTAHYSLSLGDELKTVYAQFRDDLGNSSSVTSDTIRLDMSAGADQRLSVNEGALWTNTTTVTLSIGAPEGTTAMQISNDGGFGGANWQPFNTRTGWGITSFGSYTLPRVVYVRLRLADGSVTTASSDDIVYDPLPPTGSISITGSTASSVEVALSASDPENLSGVANMRVALVDQLARTAWEPYATRKQLAWSGADGDAQICAQFRDGAGNESVASCTDSTTPTQTPTASVTATPTSTTTDPPTQTRTPAPTSTPTTEPARETIYLPMVHTSASAHNFSEDSFWTRLVEIFQFPRFVGLLASGDEHAGLGPLRMQHRRSS
jgi:hypothetical protein